MNKILKIVKSLEDSGVLLKGINNTISKYYVTWYTWCKFVRKYVSKQGGYKGRRRSN